LALAVPRCGVCPEVLQSRVPAEPDAVLTPQVVLFARAVEALNQSLVLTLGPLFFSRIASLLPNQQAIRTRTNP
jgi:hypothetical protein